MSIADLFDSEFKSRMKGRFSAVARVLYADGAFDEDEKMFLDKLALKLDISKQEYDEILENPLKYELNPPYLYIERLESLYHIAKVVHHDHHLGDKQERLLRKFAIALGFSTSNVEYIVKKALVLVDKKVDLDTFIFEMQNMNR
ncbi:TerB family tellurite resistance protein [Flavobacterium sp. RSB2_4_14]|uniref:tellurite resistance TerB family protein n=1 Tax=Flavobacterium sp. RSB2_4_14 TaxID=3447665 RepID=UPI003F2BA72A